MGCIYQAHKPPRSAKPPAFVRSYLPTFRRGMSPIVSWPRQRLTSMGPSRSRSLELSGTSSVVDAEFVILLADRAHGSARFADARNIRWRGDLSSRRTQQ